MRTGPDMGVRLGNNERNPEKYAGKEPSCALQIRAVEGIIAK
jgi:hypothetical protein